MKQSDNRHKLSVIISGGGTGGHIFPAVAIANALKKRVPDVNILFIGAKGKNGNGESSSCRLSHRRALDQWFAKKVNIEKPDASFQNYFQLVEG